MTKMNNPLRFIIKTFTYVFAAIGFTLTAGYIATYFHLTDTKGIVDEQVKNFIIPQKNTYVTFPLAHTPEWVAFTIAIAKDKNLIEKISKKTGVPARLIVAIAVPEQMRLFYSDRAVFKKVFEPLKILGSQSQFSWGLFGIKDETARAVESHLKDTSSPYYLGKQYENMLDFASSSPDQERFERIVDEHDHTYTYLYTALYIREVEAQWGESGVPISARPDIIATLWNLGFNKSTPHKDPKSGGAVLDINGRKYSFGAFANDFYYSDELIEIFPRE
jgi:hypothetical protein